MPTKKGNMRGSTIYFFNEKENSVSVYTEEKIPLSECPEEIVSDFIKDKYTVSLFISAKESKN